MPFKPGESGNPDGRPVGSVNLVTKTVRDTFIEVFLEAQTNPRFRKVSLRRFVLDYPRDFYQLAARIIPTEIRAEFRAPDGLTINFNADPKCLPIGTNPESNSGILGEQESL